MLKVDSLSKKNGCVIGGIIFEDNKPFVIYDIYENEGKMKFKSKNNLYKIKEGYVEIQDIYKIDLLNSKYSFLRELIIGALKNKYLNNNIVIIKDFLNENKIDEYKVIHVDDIGQLRLKGGTCLNYERDIFRIK